MLHWLEQKKGKALTRSTQTRDVVPEPGELRRIREGLGLTQAEAARLVYRTSRSWQAWESTDPGGTRIKQWTWELFEYKTGLRCAVRNQC